MINENDAQILFIYCVESRDTIHLLVASAEIVHCDASRSRDWHAVFFFLVLKTSMLSTSLWRRFPNVYKCLARKGLIRKFTVSLLANYRVHVRFYCYVSWTWWCNILGTITTYGAHMACKCDNNSDGSSKVNREARAILCSVSRWSLQLEFPMKKLLISQRIRWHSETKLSVLDCFAPCRFKINFFLVGQ